MHVICYSNYRINYEDKRWIIYDGDGTKSSTNGTWIYIDDSYQVTDGLVFKAAQTMFKINLKDGVSK